jgi:leucyl aminopeptidase
MNILFNNVKLKNKSDAFIYLLCKNIKHSYKLPEIILSRFNGEKNEVMTVINDDKLYIVSGLGNDVTCDNGSIKEALRDAIIYAKKINCKHISILSNVNNKNSIKIITENAILINYSFNKYNNNNNNKLKNINIIADKKYRDIVKESMIISNNVNEIRDLINEPANKLYPKSFIEIIKKKCKQTKNRIEIFDEKKLKSKKMNTILAVGQGSIKKSYMAIVKYLPIKNKKPIILVGKGVTFDSGGISIKSGNFGDMKTDMSGAAVVFGIINTISELKLKKNVIAIMPLVENMPGANAIRPGDIIKSYSGKTIEIVNTDAEGRLILADALAYASEMKPEHIIDFATLTGATAYITGDKSALTMGNNKKLINTIIKAGEETGEYIWELPMWKSYIEGTKSNIADVKNSGYKSKAGTIMAGAFLSNFVKTKSWAHCDIADVSFKDETGSSGYGVRLGVEFIKKL